MDLLGNPIFNFFTLYLYKKLKIESTNRSIDISNRLGPMESKQTTTYTLRFLIVCRSHKSILTYRQGTKAPTILYLHGLTTTDLDVIEELMVQHLAETFPSLTLTSIAATTYSPDRDKKSPCAFVYVTSEEEVLPVKKSPTSTYTWVNYPDEYALLLQPTFPEGKSLTINKSYCSFLRKAIEVADTMAI